MNTYCVKYEYCYPDADEDYRKVYVLANSFQEADEKVRKRFKGEFENAYPYKIEKIGDENMIMV